VGFYSAYGGDSLPTFRDNPSVPYSWVKKSNKKGNHALVEASLNVMAHAQKPDFVFRRNGQVHLNRRGRQFSRLLAAEVCASAVVMLDTTCSEVVWRVLATHSIRQFPLHFPSCAPPCAITFQLESTRFIQGRAWRGNWFSVSVVPASSVHIRNVDDKLPLYAARQPRRTQARCTSLRKHGMVQVLWTFWVGYFNLLAREFYI
jgi:hypothetical protein